MDLLGGNLVPVVQAMSALSASRSSLEFPGHGACGAASPSFLVLHVAIAAYGPAASFIIIVVCVIPPRKSSTYVLSYVVVSSLADALPLRLSLTRWILCH